MSDQSVDPNRIQEIIDTALAFWKSKVLLSAVELEIFTHVGDAELTARELGDKAGLHERGRADFLDALVAIGYLARSGTDENARYRNVPHVALLLNKASSRYMGGLLEMTNARVYRFWSDFTEALRTGRPQNETKRSAAGWYETLYADPELLEQFLTAMAGYQAGNFTLLVERFNFGAYRSFCDVGGASGALTIAVAQRYPGIRCINFDLPPVALLARKAVRTAELSERISVVSGDFTTDALPRADVIAMGNVLHNWGATRKKMLIGKAFEALEPGGAFIAIEHMIDDARSKNWRALLMSLDMLVETAEGFECTETQFEAWCRDAGFQSMTIEPLAGGVRAAVAYKP